MKLSVIVPVYGVEKYIARCAESLLNQNYADKELIFVDDASPDDSVVILQNVIGCYAGANVKIIHHSVNRGLAAARKTGIKTASGEYIVSVDSDDCLEPHALELLAAEAEKTGADIIGMDCYFEWNGKRSPYHGAWSSDPQEYSRILLSGRTLPGVCLHMIRKTLYTRTGIMPVEGLNNGEDYLVTPRLCWYAGSVARVEQPLYCYNQTNASSIVHNLTPGHIVQLKQVVDILTEFFGDKLDCAEALRAGQWLKKTDTMMRAEKADYALADTMQAPLPVSTGTMTRFQRPAAWMIARRHWTLLRAYSLCYDILIETVQILKGRRKKC